MWKDSEKSSYCPSPDSSQKEEAQVNLLSSTSSTYSSDSILPEISTTAFI